jgi:hypothetical protein
VDVPGADLKVNSVRLEVRCAIAMDRLDQFAAAALTGLLANSTADETWTDWNLLARAAYDIAAAMIKESAVRNGDGSRKEDPRDPQPLLLRLFSRCLRALNGWP